MILDAAVGDRSLLDRDFDVCVIGSGPAGITLARRLAARGATVALMEAGGLQFDEVSQDVYRGENVGLDYFALDTARLRYFGGTSNHWAGWSRPLDPVDFLPNPVNPWSGWPITKADLDPYAAETDAILDIPSMVEVPDAPEPGPEADFRQVRFRFSPPTRFAEKYGLEIAASERIRLVLNANLVGLALDPTGARVTEARFRGYAPGDPGFGVRAGVYCLACGGIENPRLLLNFRSAEAPEGIGNRNGLVGRFFCEHPHFVLGEAVVAELPPEILFFSPTERMRAGQGVLNFGLRLEPAFPPPDPFAPCAEPVVALLAREFGGGVCAPGGPPPNRALIRIAMEQALNPESRVVLAEETDALGLRRAALDWRVTALDIHTMRAAALTFGRDLAATGAGRMRLRDWVMREPAALPGVAQDEVGGKHHMCATRMAADPRKGVVDADCRVHGMENLHLAGSSVFATPGHANPTYTVVQLALRLGDRIAPPV